MEDRHSKASVGSKRASIRFQTPPDVKWTIANAAGTTDLIRMAGIGQTEKGSYAHNTEYWRHGSDLTTTNLNVDSLSLTCEKFAEGYADTHVNDFFTTTWTTNAFTSGRTGATWKQRRRDEPVNRTSYLFSMVDPESTNHQIGILIELDTASPYALKAVAFYKSWLPSSGLLFPENKLPLSRVALSRVKDDRSPPVATTDPAYVMIYHTVMS